MSISDALKGCFFPYQPDGTRYRLPCGRCPNCLKRRIDGWVFRLSYHMRSVKSSFFVTLTYDNASCPVSDNGFMTLRSRDVQLYFKRLRRSLGDSSSVPDNLRLKYYVSGEYGTKTFRPHYHAIVFNADPDSIVKCWHHGHVDVRPVNTSRIAYVLKYITKYRMSKRQSLHARDDRVRPFSFMSKGLGRSWLDNPDNLLKHKGNTDQPFLRLPGGQRIAIPRYYKSRLYTAEELERIADNMASLYQEPDVDAFELLRWKNEKIRLMHKRSSNDVV